MGRLTLRGYACSVHAATARLAQVSPTEKRSQCTIMVSPETNYVGELLSYRHFRLIIKRIAGRLA
ncbi:MAG: hypothetical protein QXL85_07015 [Candidatus Bathyarchaeia archaeon]